jgi:hypothetical protein
VKVASESQPPLDLVHRPAQLLTRIHVEHVRVKIQGVFNDAGFEKSERKKGAKCKLWQRGPFQANEAGSASRWPRG